MSRVCRFPSAWFATLVLAGAGLNELPLVWAAENWAAETSAASRQAAVMEAFAKPDGQTYFALKLVPQMAQPAEVPHDIVVLFDTSASQTGTYRAKAAGAVRAMLAGLSSSDRVALLAVDVNVARLTPSLTAPKGAAITQALTALDRRVPLGSTDLSLGLQTALSILTESKNAARSRSVVYLGDGLSGSNLLSMDGVQRVIAEYVDNHVACSSYVIGPAVNGLLLAALANHTGGMLVADDARMAAGQVGSYLASVADAAVIWPTSVKLPESIKNAYPRPMPPLRFDRDSVVVGSVDPAALESKTPLAVVVEAEMGGKSVDLKWSVVPQKPQPENAYLAKVVEFAAPSDGIGLPTAGSAGLSELRHWSNFGAQQLARLGKGAFALGQTEAAAQLATQAEELDPDNAEAATVRAAAVRSKQPAPNRQPVPGDLRLVRAQAEPMPEVAADADLPEAGDGELLESVERNQRVVEGFLRSEVNNALNQARATMSVDPEGTRGRLKLLLDKVQHTAELEPEVRGQFIDKIEAALRETDRMVLLTTEKNLQQQVIRAEGEARERINRELFLQEQKVDQLMSRFDALMDEERYRDAEALADIAEEIEPGRPGLRGAELTARMVGYTADIMAVLDLRRKGFVDATYQIELSHVPTPDEPPILYPDPEVWQLLTERRKKYKAVDLTQHGPTETAILAALDEKTDLDFSDQPLADVVEYLKQRHGIEIQLDSKALSDAGVATDTPVTRNIKGITLRSALKLLLSEYELTYVIANEVLMITSKTEAENKLSTRVYPVGDLVIPATSPIGGGRGMFNVADDEAGPPAVKAPRLRAQLVKDDLKVTKKGAKPQGAAAPEAKAKPRGAKPAAAARENVPNVGRPEQGAVGPPPVARRRGEKIEPIQIEFKDGDDIDMKWNDYFAAHSGNDAPSEAVVRETIRQLKKAKKFDHIISCIYAALRNQQGQPWMYEVLSLAMQADGRPAEEIERVLLSALDFATNPLEVMYLAQYMARSGLDKRALQLYRQVSMMLPAAPQPYVAGLQLAQKLDDLEGIEWATLGILGQPWPNQQIKVWETGWNVAEATLARLKSENRKEEAESYRNAVNEALRRDLVVIVSWTGDADVDLLVEEPAGSVCSYRVPYTLSGGIMLGDSAGRSKTDELKAQGSQEAYVCPKAFNGEYRIMVRRVWGKVTNDKVTVEVLWHYWSKKERTLRKQIDVSGGDAVCLVDLEGGRRTEPLEQQQVLNAVANQLGASMLFTGVQQLQAANELDAARQAAQQMNAQNDLAVTGSMARSRARQVGEVPRGQNPVNPFFVRGATGYQPVISTLPQGGMMFTTAVVSADRRYVRISPIPFFSVVSEVNTFNFVTGQGGSSAGGGAGGFGGGGGAGGLGGFGGGRGGGGGGGI